MTPRAAVTATGHVDAKLDPVRHFWLLNFSRNLSGRKLIRRALNDAESALAPDEVLYASETEDEPQVERRRGTSETLVRQNEQRLDAVSMLLQQRDIQDMHNLD